MENNNKVDKYQGIIVLVLLMIVIIPAIILNTVDISPHKLIIQDDIIKVGVKSFKVEDIKTVKLLEDININYRIKGTKTLNYLRGLYAIEGENQDANVYIYRNICWKRSFPCSNTLSIIFSSSFVPSVTEVSD